MDLPREKLNPQHLNGAMVDKKKKQEPPEKNPPKEWRDLKPTKEVKGGARKAGQPAKRTPGSTGEIDFMNWD